MTVRILVGDVRATLAGLPDGSVQCVVTSPPYFGLRDYGTAAWDGGDPACDHGPEKRGGRFATPVSGKQASNAGSGTASSRDCPCGARRVDAQIGLEPTPDAYVAELVALFRAVRRVLRDDGTVWLNLGDSYASTAPGTRNGSGTGLQSDPGRISMRPDYRAGAYAIKPKDLMGIPWRVAFALQADGWWLRSDIVWHKPNPMPESVTDRPTKAHEYVFLLTKAERYYYDADAIREESATPEERRATKHGRQAMRGQEAIRPRGNVEVCDDPAARYYPAGGRNARSVWPIATQPYRGAHFATMPPALAERCVLAGTSPQACETCGAAWRRVVERGDAERDWRETQTARTYRGKMSVRSEGHASELGEQSRPRETTGWAPTCACATNTGAGRCVVLDPFGGAGTTGLVADRLGRDAILCELNPAYATLAADRIRDEAPMLATVTLEDAA